MAHRLAVLKRALASRRLRRVMVGFLGFGIEEMGVWVVVLVYAYDHGGTTTAAVIAVVQLLPAALVAPLAGRLIDRRGAGAALLLGYTVQAGAIATSAVLLLIGATPLIVYAAAVGASCAVTLTRPAQAALLPAVVDTPAQLAAANVVSGWMENMSLLVGPAVASIVLESAGPGEAMAVFAGLVACSAAIVAPLQTFTVESPVPEDETSETPLLGVLRDAPGAAPAVGMLVAEYAALGALDVMEVVLAARVLRVGAGSAGYLGAVFGIGGLVGTVAAIALVGRHRLAVALLRAGGCWGVAFIALAAWPALGFALCMLALAGASRALLDIGGRTTLYRTVAPGLHARLFGALEGLEMLGLAAGSVAVPLFVAVAGARGALALVGGLLVAVPLAAAPRLRAAERAAPPLTAELALLRGATLFAMLAPPVLETLARALRQLELAPGETIVHEGTIGDQFYLVADGELSVSFEGRQLRRLGPGDGFGEIALLRDGRRTATVTAMTPATLYALERAAFLEGVTGSRRAHAAATALVAQRLAGA